MPVNDGTKGEQMSPIELARQALAQWAAATPGPWNADFAYNNGGCPTAMFAIPGHNQGAEVEMMEADAYAIAAARTREPQLAEAVIALTAERDRAEAHAQRAENQAHQWKLERDALRAELNTPHTADFLEAVRLEAAHQRQRWGTEHDAGKTDADWFWLIGWLAGKAVHAGAGEKRLHHVITAAAALLNWHAALTGSDTRMRPGIATPDGE